MVDITEWSTILKRRFNPIIIRDGKFKLFRLILTGETYKEDLKPLIDFRDYMIRCQEGKLLPNELPLDNEPYPIGPEEWEGILNVIWGVKLIELLLVSTDEALPENTIYFKNYSTK